MSKIELLIWAVGALVLVGGWVTLRAAGRGAEWAAGRVLGRWGMESGAPLVVAGLVVGLALLLAVLLGWWSWLIGVAVVVVALALADVVAARLGIEKGRKALPVLAVAVGVGVVLWGPWRAVDGGAASVALPEASAVPAVMEAAPGAAEAVDCLCSAGAVCAGPRGGQYCLTGDGKKRYK